jgi:magnesium-protoporphyrin IX monomethyl ester (oxidative) cyclase
MEDLRVAADAIEEARVQGGLAGGVKRLAATARCGLAFARLYLTPVKDNALPATTRLQPAW